MRPVVQCLAVTRHPILNARWKKGKQMGDVDDNKHERNERRASARSGLNPLSLSMMVTWVVYLALLMTMTVYQYVDGFASSPSHARNIQTSLQMSSLPNGRSKQRRSASQSSKNLASLSSTLFPTTSNKQKQQYTKTVPKRNGYNATWSEDLDDYLSSGEGAKSRSFASKSPFPMMPSSLFMNLAQSQFELLSHSLIHTSIVSDEDDVSSTGQKDNIKLGTPKTSSMILYLPKENQNTGQLEFVPAVTYPNPLSERVFIASDSSDNGTHQPPVVPSMSVWRLPGFTSAKELIPSYPFFSSSTDSDEEDAVSYGENTRDVVFTTASPDSSVGVSIVEEISPVASSGPTSLSVTMFSGLDTLGVMMIWPYRAKDETQNQWKWTRNDKLQVSRAAKSLALALSMDTERASTQIQSEQFRMAFADSLHQVKSPLQALRTFGKLLQRQLAEENSVVGPTLQRMPRNATSESDYNSSWGRRQRQALKLAEDMVKQGERVIDLIEPMDVLVHDGRYLLRGDTLESSANATARLLPSSQSSAIELYQQQSFGDFIMEMCFPQDVLGPIVYTSQAISRECGIDFEVTGFDPDAELPGVRACPNYLQEAVSNLLDNAIKYTPIKFVEKKRGRGRPRKNSLPQIKVSLLPNKFPLSPGVTLYIEDNGPGIPKSERDSVFQRGYRSEDVRDAVEGTGLGLNLSMNIIQRMGGMLDILDDGPSHLGGATIRLILFRNSDV